MSTHFLRTLVGILAPFFFGVGAGGKVGGCCIHTFHILYCTLMEMVCFCSIWKINAEVVC